MTHDPRALELIASVRDDDDDAMALAYAHDALDALTTAGLRVVSAGPTEADVARVARALADELDGRAPEHRDYLLARAAIRAFLAGGGDE
jgi:hypothetical protein